jgi:hypothetical protein
MSEEYQNEADNARDYYAPQGYGHGHSPSHYHDSFSEAIARAHLSITGYHQYPYGHMAIPHPAGAHMEDEGAYYQFAQAQAHAHAQASQQAHLAHQTQQSVVPDRQQSANQPSSGDQEGKYQCSMCDRSFSRYVSFIKIVQSKESCKNSRKSTSI